MDEVELSDDSENANGDEDNDGDNAQGEGSLSRQFTEVAGGSLIGTRRPRSEARFEHVLEQYGRLGYSDCDPPLKINDQKSLSMRLIIHSLVFIRIRPKQKNWCSDSNEEATNTSTSPTPAEKAFRYRCSVCGNITEFKTLEYSNLVRHLKGKHERLYLSLKAAFDLYKDKGRTRTARDEALQAIYSLLLDHVSPTKKQATLDGILVSRASGDQQIRLVNFTTVLAFVSRGIPLTNLDQPEIRGVFKALARCNCLGGCSLCKVTGRSGAKSVLYEAHTGIHMYITEALKNTVSISCTVDGWKDSQRRKYIAVTGHWIDANFKVRSAVLGFIRIAGRAYASVVKIALKSILDRYKGADGNALSFLVASITSDNEASIVRAILDYLNSTDDRQSCFAHTLCLCVNDALAISINGLTPKMVCLKLRRIVAKLRSCRLDEDITKKTGRALVLPAETRWSSEYYMIDAFVDMQDTVEEAWRTVANDVQWFTARELELIHAMQECLRPFEKVIRYCEGEKYVSAALIPYWISELQRSCEYSDSDSYCVSQLKANLLRGCMRLDQYLDLTTSGCNIALKAAALHPEFCQLECLALQSDKKLVHASIAEEAVNLASIMGTSFESSGSDSSEEEHNDNLKEYYEKELKKCRKAMKKFRRNNPRVDGHHDALAFWKDEKYGGMFPVLKQVAKMLLAVPATSAPCEREFSSAGFLDKRARGQSNDLEILCYVRDNLRMLTAVENITFSDACALLCRLTSDVVVTKVQAIVATTESSSDESDSNDDL